MKPIIIVTEEKDGYIRMKKEDLERHIKEAYQSGLEDANAWMNPYRHSITLTDGSTPKYRGSTTLLNGETVNTPYVVNC